MIFGVDVYSGYGRLNHKLAASAGVRFMWCKSAEGNEPARNDFAFARNVQGCRDNGIVPGAYFFPYPLPSGPGLPSGRGPLEQAQRFYEVTKGLGSQPGELSPAVDAEWPSPEEWGKWGCSPEQINDWLREHCEAVALLFGRLPIIYTYPWWWRTLAISADVSWASRYPLWMATYTHFGPGTPEVGSSPQIPTPWTNWDAWQYSANGSSVRVPGIPAVPVDRDVIRDEATFRRLTGQRDYDPDAETQPDPLQAKSFSRLNEMLDAERERRHRELRDSEPPPPDDAA